MDSVALKQEDLVQWAVGESPFPGQTVSGDGHLVAAFPGGVLLAVIDGLGHGAEAAAATTAALSALGANVGKPVVRLMEASHEALRQTRGAAISLGSVFMGAMTYIGNGPNFMVKAIADQQKAHTPTFLGYVFKYTLPYMVPMLLIVWWLFFR